MINENRSLYNEIVRYVRSCLYNLQASGWEEHQTLCRERIRILNDLDKQRNGLKISKMTFDSNKENTSLRKETGEYLARQQYGRRGSRE